MLHRLSGDTWMVCGGLPVKELADRLGLKLPDAQGTTSAWLIRRLGRVPNVNEVYRLDGAEFLVRRTRRGTVFEVSVMRAGHPEQLPPARTPQPSGLTEEKAG
jgi:CBS domain containing-hemolysin-like protein